MVISQADVHALMALAEQAAEVIMASYDAPTGIQRKEDNTLLTEADQASSTILVEGLQSLFPFPVISEEEALPDFEERRDWPYLWLVDPLDGTREFVEHTGEFTINIALIHEHVPIFGLIYVPVEKQGYYAIKGQGAFRYPQTPLQGGSVGERWRCLVSRHHFSKKVAAWLPKAIEITRIPCGSALKFCRLAEGEADLYPRFGPTSEWDTAAGQCLLEAAGGQVFDLQGQPLRYNTKPSLQNPAFVAVGDITHDWQQYLNGVPPSL